MATFHLTLRAAAMLRGAIMILAISGCTTDRMPLPTTTAAQPCPLWVSSVADSHSNADSPFGGCVSAANLRAMVANPEDLQVGRELGPANGERETRAVEAYQLGKVKAFQGGGDMTPQLSSPGAAAGSSP